MVLKCPPIYIVNSNWTRRPIIFNLLFCPVSFFFQRLSVVCLIQLSLNDTQRNNYVISEASGEGRKGRGCTRYKKR